MKAPEFYIVQNSIGNFYLGQYSKIVAAAKEALESSSSFSFHVKTNEIAGLGAQTFQKLTKYLAGHFAIHEMTRKGREHLFYKVGLR